MKHQYTEIKAQYPAVILLFETDNNLVAFDDDAVLVSNLCDVPFLENGSGLVVNMPGNKIQKIIAKLINSGCRVAICSQLEENHAI